MSNVKRLASLALAAAMSVTALAACSTNNSSDSNSPASGEKGSVYFLNWKPESEDTYLAIAKEYEAKTGVKVRVVTAASGTYEQTLQTEMSKSDAPTLFQINGPVGLQSWQKYAADLTDTTFAKDLSDPGLALKGDDGKVYGVPLAVEGYGIIYNDAIMKKYFAMDGAKAKSVDDIKGFDKLKEVADDMQAKKADLGIDGVFASTSLLTGEAWRWQTHLMDIPVYYEYQADKVSDTDALKFTFNNEFKNIFDLYLTDSTVAKTLAPSKSVSDSMAEFATGKAAMVQNGNWAWSQIKDVPGNAVAEGDIKFMPIYTGHEGEAKQGLNVGTEAFMAVNTKAKAADQKATIDFINWLFSDTEGMKQVTEQLGFIAPFKSFGTNTPQDPLAKEINRYISNPDLNAVPWVFGTFPSSKFKDDFAQLLAQYASGNVEWDAVTKGVVDNWATEKAALKKS